MSDEEFSSVENRFGFQFPPDLKSILKLGLPVSKKFPDWRNGDAEEIQGRFDRVTDGICFDIEHNNFWMEEWGAKPPIFADAFAVARSYIKLAPRLIPIFVHRYIPAEPNEIGNPVFSIVQTDIIYYGMDLASYLSAEFKFTNPFPIPSKPKNIRLWSKLEELNS
ncbi:MAG TPA: hypothetical protein VFC85_07665 [Verrucomicrobiae bacterium]|nr:hypothetical protein [Verrucomicrobiae bacterium]